MHLSVDGAVVIGGDYRGLGVTRSLGRRGIPVWVLNDEHRIGAMSRYAARRLHWPSGQPQQKQVDFLVNLAINEKIKDWMLFPTADDSVALIARHHQLLKEHYRLTTPAWDKLQPIFDKRLLHRVALDLGLDHPLTFFPRSREELLSLDCPFPVILKPAMRLDLNRLTSDKAWRVEDRASLLVRYDEACSLVSPEILMVQEVIPGWGEAQFSYAALCKDGSPVASVVARRTRQFPMDFGRFSTYVETVDEPQIIEPALRLLAATGLSGLVEIEFKRDSRNGKFKILDVNPRVWGWHTLSRRSGLDFAYLLWRLTRGAPVPALRGHAGQRWMRLACDLPIAIQEIMQGRLSLGAYLRSLRGSVESALFAWDDPVPGFLELPLLMGMFGKRLIRGEGI